MATATETAGTAAARHALPAELVDFIALWKTKPGNLIMVLHKVQGHYGYIRARSPSRWRSAWACRWRRSTGCSPSTISSS